MISVVATDIIVQIIDQIIDNISKNVNENKNIYDDSLVGERIEDREI